MKTFLEQVQEAIDSNDSLEREKISDQPADLAAFQVYNIPGVSFIVFADGLKIHSMHRRPIFERLPSANERISGADGANIESVDAISGDNLESTARHCYWLMQQNPGMLIRGLH